MKTRILILLWLICVPLFLKAQSAPITIAKYDSSASTKSTGYTLTLLTDEHDSDVVTGRSSLNSLGSVDVCILQNETKVRIFKCTNSQGKPITLPNLAKGKYTVICRKQGYISISCVIDIGASFFTCITDKSEKAKFNCGSNIDDDKVYNLYVTMLPE